MGGHEWKMWLFQFRLLFEIAAMGIVISGSGECADEIFYSETVVASQECLKPKLVKRMVENSDCILETMQGWGIPFENHEKSREISCFGKTSRGHQLLNLESTRAVYLQELKINGVKMIEDFHVAELLVYQNQCFGVVGFDADQKLLSFKIKIKKL